LNVELPEGISSGKVALETAGLAADDFWVKWLPQRAIDTATR
jgi:hypothetical protein